MKIDEWLRLMWMAQRNDEIGEIERKANEH